MVDFSKMTDGDFDRVLANIVNKEPAANLLTIPGVYDAVSEEFNNAVLAEWEKEQNEG